MRSIFPLLPFTYYQSADGTLFTGLVPTANTPDITSNPLNFTIHVPPAERWLVNFNLSSWIQGPNAPSYQCGFGLVLRGATVFTPPTVTSGAPWWYWLGIATAGDQAWGQCNPMMWLNPGETICHFGYGRDAGAVSLQRRRITAQPLLGMKI